MQKDQEIINIAILGHGNSGKTTLAESLLYSSGTISCCGKVDAGTSVMDFNPEEIMRKISLTTSYYYFTSHNKQVFLLDTPGDDQFLNETRTTLQGADLGLFTIGAVLGVKGQTEKFVDIIEDLKLPAMICITKMDRERANFYNSVQEIKTEFAINPVIIQMPIGEAQNFRGVVDLISGQANFFSVESESNKVEIGAVPEDMIEEVAKMRERLMEHLADSDDDLLELFLEEGELTQEQIVKGLKKALLKKSFTPICCCSGLTGKGSHSLLNLITLMLPNTNEVAPKFLGDIHNGDSEPEQLSNLNVTPDTKFSAQVIKTFGAPFGDNLKTFSSPFIDNVAIVRIFSGTLQSKDRRFYNVNQQLEESFNKIYVLQGQEYHKVTEAYAGMIIAIPKLKKTVTGDTLTSKIKPLKKLYQTQKPLQATLSYALNYDLAKEDKLILGLKRLQEEDLGIKFHKDQTTNEMIIKGMGHIQLEVTKDRLLRKFGIAIEYKTPQVAYTETITLEATAQGIYQKQHGGRKHFGHCCLKIEPLAKGQGFDFIDQLESGAIPHHYHQAIIDGIKESMTKGIISHNPIVDLRVYLVDGSYDPNYSSEMAFKAAAGIAFKKSFLEACPTLLEPIMKISITIKYDHVGDIMGDLNSRRGRILGIESATNRYEVINGIVPQAEILNYTSDLSDKTGGLGSFSSHFSHYEKLPSHLQDNILVVLNAKN